MVDTILSRSSLSLRPFHYPSSQNQKQAEALVSGFVEHATDGYSLAALAGGGLVYRLGRVGTMALGSRLVGAYGRTPLHLLIRPVSIGVGFAGEVFTFEAGQRFLRVKFGGADPALLNWSGENGLGRGLIGAAITLGSLKGTGAFVQGQNPVLQHLFQDSAMVLAHHVSGRLEIVPKPDGSLPEQFLNAEATLWQMKAGMGLIHGAFPRLGQLERSLDLSIRSRVGVAPRGRPQLEGRHRGLPLHSFYEPLPALAGEVSTAKEQSPNLSISLMTAQGPGSGGRPAIVPFEGGALALGGKEALKWLLAVREIIENRSVSLSFRQNPKLVWIPDSPLDIVLLNKWGWALREEKQDFERINEAGRIPITALPTLLKPGELFILPKQFTEELEKILNRWQQRDDERFKQFITWSWLEQQFKRLYQKKTGVREVGFEKDRRIIYFHDGKRMALPASLELYPEPSLMQDSQKAVGQFQNQFWGRHTPQEMETMAGEKALSALPPNPVITQIIHPNAVMVPTPLASLRNRSDTHFFIVQGAKAWVAKLVEGYALDGGNDVDPFILEFLFKMVGQQPPKLPPPLQDPTHSLFVGGIPEAVEAEKVTAIIRPEEKTVSPTRHYARTFISPFPPDGTFFILMGRGLMRWIYSLRLKRVENKIRAREAQGDLPSLELLRKAEELRKKKERWK